MAIPSDTAPEHRHATDALYRGDFTAWSHVEAFPVYRIYLILSGAADG